MKKYLSVVLTGAALAGAPLLFAQDQPASPGESPSASPGPGQKGPGGHHTPGDHHFEPFSAHLLMDLQLTEDQKARIKTIMESAKGQGHKPGELKEVLEQIRQILTPEQQQLVDDFKKYAGDRMALRKQNGGKGGDQGAPDASPSPSPAR